MIALFLEHSLRLSPEASQNACRMEHFASEEMLAAIKRYLKEHNLSAGIYCCKMFSV